MPSPPLSSAALANLVAQGIVRNTTGRTLTRTNVPALRWTGTRYTYVLRAAKGKKVTRTVVPPSAPKRRARKPRAFKGVATEWANRKKRTFYLTPRQAYVLRLAAANGIVRSAYGRKALYQDGDRLMMQNLANVPYKIRPKRAPRPKVLRR